MENPNLQSRLQQLGRRQLGIASAAAIAMGLLGLVALLTADMGVDLVLELSPALRLMALAAVILGAAGAAARPLLRIRPQLRRSALAQSLDTASQAHGEIVSGSDLAETAPCPVGPASGMTQALADLAVQRAARLAGQVPLAKAAPLSRLARPALSAGIVLVLAGVLALLAPRLVRMQWARLVDPFGDHPPYSRLQLAVAPGNTSVLYGQPVEISVTATGGDMEEAELVWLPQGDAAAQTLPMFRETGGRWRGTIAEATASGQYFVRTPSARSYRYQVGVVMVPRIQSAEFRITPPAYVRNGNYEGPLPKEGLRGLAGTKVHVTITANRPLAAGTLTITPTQPTPATTRPALTLSPVSPGANQVAGAFELDRSGNMTIDVRDREGNRCSEPFSAAITLLKDGRPLVRLLQPEAMSLATPSTMLPIEVVGEDDYGVARLQIFRGLNQSRPRPAEFPIPLPLTTRADGVKLLRLAALGLKPGDSLQLFARAEDNDPAGAKGVESPVTLVQIISEEDMKQLVLARAGMETLLGKYQEAQRHVESLREKLDTLDKALAKDPTSDSAGKDLEEALKKFEQVEHRLKELTEEDLPLDLDKALKGELEQLTEQVSDARVHLTAARGSGPARVAEAVKAARQALAAAEEEFARDATGPLDAFAKAYALKEDEARFVDLYLHQKDLAERLASFKDQVVVEDALLKPRLRDLEEEQREIHQELDDLLASIESHITELPEDPKFDRLRDSAREFARKARECGAGERMKDAEVALSSFAGGEVFKQAQEAAENLRSLLKQCETMGEAGEDALAFSPTLSGAMGQTVEQLLSAQGIRGVKGMGTGGYSAHRSTLQNVGLYGSRPTSSQPRDAGGGGRTNPGVIFAARNTPADSAGSATGAAPKAVGAGGSQLTVPGQYQRRVSDYYQRVADELEPADRRAKGAKR